MDYQASSARMSHRGEWDNFGGSFTDCIAEEESWDMGIFGFTLVWRNISTEAFPPSAITPPSHLPSVLHLVLARSCCRSASLLSTCFFSFPPSMHPQLLCLHAACFPQLLVSSLLPQLVLVLECYSLILPQNMLSFSNIILLIFNSTSPLSSIPQQPRTPSQGSSSSAPGWTELLRSQTLTSKTHSN